MTIIQAKPLKQFGISGPISAIDNEVPVFDGVTGKKIKAATGIICPSSGRLDLAEIRAKDGNGLKLCEDGGAGIFVKDGGNVGIGTTSPLSKFSIQGTAGTDLINVALPTTGASALYVAEDGNVGIGTANPNYKLETVGKITSHAPVFGDTGLIIYGDNGMAMALAVGSGASAFLFDNAGRFGIQARTRANVISGIASGDDEKLTVLANGRVGIHDITPSRVLDIQGIAGDDPFVVHSSAGVNILCADESGSVGVMTEGDTIVSELQVGKAVDGNDAFITIAGGRGGSASLYAGLDFRNYDEVSAYTGARIGSRNDDGVSDGNLEFYIADAGSLSVAANMIINSSGNVGIGTGSPTSALHVDATTAGSGSYGLHVKQNTEWSGALPYALYVEGYTYLNGFRIEGGANVRSLYKVGAGNIDFATSDGNISFSSYNPSFYQAMYIVGDSGNVGIDTTTPTAKLDINSDVIRLRTAKTPASAGAAGNQGDECWDADYHYRCVATNTWKRTALTTW